jgi:AcrR family transcriptional regulator
MGIVERKEREKQEMRQQILVAARSLFLTQGFEKTSIRNIADAIEYSPGTIYLYFKDKNELFLELHREAFMLLMQELYEVSKDPDPFERLVDLGAHYFKFAFENPELYDLMFVMVAPMEALECKEEVWEDGRTAFGFLNKIVADCQAKGYFVDQEMEDVSLGIWSFVHGLSTLYSKNRMQIFPEEERHSRMENAYGVFVQWLRTQHRK